MNTVFGHPEFRGAREAIVSHVAGGGGALVPMPTGGGKSLCYRLPAPYAKNGPIGRRRVAKGG